MRDANCRAASVTVEPIVMPPDGATWYLARYTDGVVLVAAPVTDPGCADDLGAWHAWPDGRLTEMDLHVYAHSFVVALALCRQKQLEEDALDAEACEEQINRDEAERAGHEADYYAGKEVSE